jgi:hypothetical protein
MWRQAGQIASKPLIVRGITDDLTGVWLVQILECKTYHIKSENAIVDIMIYEDRKGHQLLTSPVQINNW